MDVSGVSQGNAGVVDLASKVDVAITKMVMDNSKQNAQGMQDVMDASTKQLERSVNPSVGGSIDIKL